MRFSILCLSLLLLGLAGTSRAETYGVQLGARPGVDSPGTGEGTLVLNSIETDVEYAIRVRDLTSGEIAAHIHRPDGSIAVQLPLGELKSGLWRNIGTLDLFLLKANKLYVLVHTEANPGGELIGDVVLGLVPVEDDTVGRLKSRFSDRTSRIR